MTYTPTSPTPLLDPVLKELGTEIISGKIPAGQRFTLQDLCTRFGISRTVAREVMRALEQLNLVHASRRVGITVLEKKDWAVFDKSVIAWRLETPQERDLQLHSLTQLRIAVEPIAARAAANNANPEERTRLVELSTLICDLGRSGMGNSPDFLDADIEFHTLILTSSRNEMFASLASTVATVLTARNWDCNPTIPPTKHSTTTNASQPPSLLARASPPRTMLACLSVKPAKASQYSLPPPRVDQ